MLLPCQLYPIWMRSAERMKLKRVITCVKIMRSFRKMQKMV